MKAFTKDEGVVTIGRCNRLLKEYMEAINSKCRESTIVGFRDWHSKQKSLTCLEKGRDAAMLALTVGHAVKTIHFVAPAEKDKKARRTLIDRAKARVAAANLGKAIFLMLLELSQGFRGNPEILARPYGFCFVVRGVFGWFSRTSRNPSKNIRIICLLGKSSTVFEEIQKSERDP